MKKLDMYKSAGKGKEPVRKTIQEITEELQGLEDTDHAKESQATL